MIPLLPMNCLQSYGCYRTTRDTAKGNRPSFSGAAAPDEADRSTEPSAVALQELDVEVATGVFGARMAVELVNDGPVTIVVAV